MNFVTAAIMADKTSSVVCAISTQFRSGLPWIWISMDISMDITLAHLQIFDDYLCALSLYLSFLFVFFYFLFAHLKDCGYLNSSKLQTSY